MVHDLGQQEEELKLLIRKIDSEIDHFETMKDEIRAKRASLERDVKEAGLQPVPIQIVNKEGSEENLEYEIERHILELNKTKNFISSKLNLVLKEEEFVAGLQKKYGKEVGIKKISKGDFELVFADKATAIASNELAKSKKMLSTVKQSIQSLTEDKKKN